MSTTDDVVEWHVGNGGSPERPAGHALRLLHEAVELCAAAGASRVEIMRRLELELNKAQDKGEFTYAPNNSKIREELADVSILVDILAHWTGNSSLERDREMKLDVLRSRYWVVDRDGVLWQPGRVPEDRR